MPRDVIFDGGSDADREQVLEALHAYLNANATFDSALLAEIWSHAPSSVFFNMNGHTYVGLAQWTRLWKYYRDRVDTGLWEPYDINVLIRGDMALVTCHRKTQRRWRGPKSERLAYDVDKSAFVSRSTMVMLREPEGWKTVHAHFSKASAGRRPGNI
jgi:ketosteroid isomerase-like protein